MKYVQFNVSWWNYAISEYQSNAEWNIKDTIHSNDVCLATVKSVNNQRHIDVY